MVNMLYAVLGALLLVKLSFDMMRLHIQYHIDYGDGDFSELQAAIRAHDNTVEYMPIGLILLLLAEMDGAQIWMMHIYGILLIIGRLMYSWDFHYRIYHQRRSGMSATWYALLLMVLANLRYMPWKSVFSLRQRAMRRFRFSGLNAISHRDTLLSTLTVSFGDWTFDERAAEVFLNMVQRSVFDYSNVILMIDMLAGHLVRSNTQVYDLGRLLGVAALSVRRDISHLGCRIIAIDNSPAMIGRCHHHIDAYKTPIPAEVIEGNIRDAAVENTSLVILNFTIQFLEPGDRRAILNKVYQGFDPGGALVLSKKFSFEDAHVDELLFNMHHDFKRANGYDKLEVSQKCSTSRDAMLTDSVEAHKACLHQAGFEHAELWLQCFNFGSPVVIKSGERA